ncbi:MAG: hypothetical protein V4436_01875 [Patescibacteria group bacterium]
MFFRNRAVPAADPSTVSVPSPSIEVKPLASLQAAQVAGLMQAHALVGRIRRVATPEERASLGCGESFRLLELYAINLVEVIAFEHLDTDKSKGTFRFLTRRLQVNVEISLERERTTIRRLSSDGFKEVAELPRWKPVQACVWVYRAWENGYSPDVDESLIHIRGTELESCEDLPLKPITFF